LYFLRTPVGRTGRGTLRLFRAADFDPGRATFRSVFFAAFFRAVDRALPEAFRAVDFFFALDAFAFFAWSVFREDAAFFFFFDPTVDFLDVDFLVVALRPERLRPVDFVAIESSESVPANRTAPRWSAPARQNGASI
jgi:hypothetical protein